MLYKLMFILPLAGILIIGYLGVKSECMVIFLRRRLVAFKLGMAVLFAGLGVLVMVTVSKRCVMHDRLELCRQASRGLAEDSERRWFLSRA